MTAAGRQHGQKKEGKREAGGTESSFTFPSSADGRTFVPRLEGDGGDFQARLGAIPTRGRARVSPILSCGVIDSLIEASRIQPPRCTALLPSPSPRSPSCPSGERRPPRPDQIREGRTKCRRGRPAAGEGAKLKGDWIERADFGRILLIRTFFSFGRLSDRSTDRHRQTIEIDHRQRSTGGVESGELEMGGITCWLFAALCSGGGLTCTAGQTALTNVAPSGTS